MNILRTLSRFVVGIVFILSSILKAVDPVGVALKVKEYLTAYSLPDFGSFTIVLAIGLCLLEFVVGFAVLKVIKIKIFSFIALLMTVFFLVLTFFSAAFSLVTDCGCFGEAIHLSAWGTFIKNVILLILCVIVYHQRKNYKPLFNNYLQIILLLISSIFIVGLSLYSLIYLPPVDFTDFKPSTDLTSSSENTLKYKTEVIYEKDGKREKFDLDNLPDSTWSYVATNSILLEGNLSEVSKAKFVIKDEYGEYVTEEVLNSSSPIIFISFYDKNRVEPSDIMKLKSLADSLSTDNCAEVYILSALSLEDIEKIVELQPFKVVYSDYKTVITFNRSNGGATCLMNGVVIKKWSALNYSNKKIINFIQTRL